MIYCQKCNRFKKTTSFHRDDPILECGHIKQIDLECENLINNLINDLCNEIMTTYNIKHETAMQLNLLLT